MLKKLLTLTLVFMLTFGVGLAEVTRANISIDTEDTGVGDIPAVVYSTAVVGDTVYLATHEGLYTWSAQTGEIGKLALESCTYAIIGGSMGVYYLDTLSGSLFPIDFEGLQATMGNAIALDWAIVFPGVASESVENATIPRQVYTSFFIDNMLYLQLSASDIVDWQTSVLYRFDIETGKGEQLHAGQDMVSVCAYKDGKLLTIHFDQNEYVKSREDAKYLPCVQVFEPDTKRFTDELFKLTDTNAVALAYDATTDGIYFSRGNTVMYKTSNAELKVLSYLPLSRVDRFAQGMLIGNLFYGLYIPDRLLVRALSPENRPNDTLRVAGALFEWEGRLGYWEFTNKYPDVSVVSLDYGRGWDAEDVFLDMKTDTAADIYILSSIDSLEMLIEKDYCADLTDKAIIFDAVKAMYPHLTDYCFKDGKLYALPFHFYPEEIWAYSPSLLEEIGLTHDDLPTTFSGFLDFIVEWVEIYSPDFPHLKLAEYQSHKWRDDLVLKIFRQQISYCISKEIPVTFDTPEMRALLTKLDSIASVLAQLDSSEATNNIFAEDTPLTGLFSLGHPLLGPNYSHFADYIPLRMSYIEDAPMFTLLNTMLLIVNPASPNQELAKNLLAELATNIEPPFRIMLEPNYNEPLISIYGQNQVTFYEQLVKEKQAAYDAADEAEKKTASDVLEDAKRQLNKAEDEKYGISIAQIEAYRNLAHTVLPMTGEHSFFVRAENLSTLFSRYFGQQITADQYITETEKVLQRMYSEDR